MLCNQCGSQTSDSARFCHKCGLSLVESDVNPIALTPKHNLQNQKSKEIEFSNKIIHFSLILLAVLVIGIVIAKNSKSENFEDPFQPIESIQETDNSNDVTSLEDTVTDDERLKVLKSLDFGFWTASVPENSSRGSYYVSNWPCSIFMADTFEDAVNYWNWKVNVQFYAGKWLAIQDKYWIVNDVSQGGECIRYFANVYGGNIQQQG